MVQAGGDLDLAQEAGGSDRRGQLGAEHLDGDGALVLEVVGEVDLGHPALPELALERIARLERLSEAIGELRHASNLGRTAPA